jgi:hypothetical protein
LQLIAHKDIESLADILADIFVPYFTKEINNIFTFLIMLADVLADLKEQKQKKTIQVLCLSMIPCGPYE